MTDTLVDISNTVIEGFTGQAISKATLSLANKSTGSRPFGPMRNRKGAFDIAICITCLSGPIGQIEGIGSVSHADVSVVVVLQDCRYSHDDGFTWNKDDGSYEFTDYTISPSIVFYDGEVALNGNDTANDYLAGFDKSIDLQSHAVIKKQLLESTNEEELFDVFNELLNKGSLYSKDGKN